MMLVGKQPGDQEDKAGAPFVGPAGRLLDKALVAADVNRDRLYVTNAVNISSSHWRNGESAASQDTEPH